jgi:hypothetical protein
VLPDRGVFVLPETEELVVVEKANLGSGFRTERSQRGGLFETMDVNEVGFQFGQLNRRNQQRESALKYPEKRWFSRPLRVVEQ